MHLERCKAIMLLAFLVLADQRHNRDRLAALLWPELNQQRARRAYSLL
jgi:DNA-binding SARP family transcriptional activator